MTQPSQPAQPEPARSLTVPLAPVPISTILIIIIAIVGGADIVVTGHLSDDFRDYIAIIGASSGLLAIGRGVDAHSKP